MRRIRLLFVLLFYFTGMSILLAQSKTITGKVSLADEGTVLPGVSVVLKGTKFGTTTDGDGNYRLTVPGNDGILVFTSVGMVAMEVPLEGKSVIDVQMKTDSKQLSEVIVTALGLKEDRDKFASSVTNLQGKSIAKSGETSALTGLSGKASGVLITRNGGDPGAGAYIQIRGQNTINGNAQPLFIVDGIPVSNSSDNYGAAAGNSIVQQSRLNDFAPEDIESMEVLKGASAAALWGTRAANGVVIITTKKGKDTKGKVNISFKSTLSFDKVNKMHPLQRSFGQGSGGYYQQGSRNTFGDLISDRQGGEDTYITDATQSGYNGYVTFPDGTQRYAIASGTASNPHGGKNSRETYDHSKDVFQTGHFWDNNLTISGGNARSNLLLSYSNLDQDGIVKGFSKYKRNNVRLNASSQFTDWLKASANIGYTKSYSTRIQQGDNVDGILLGGMRTSPDFDNSYYTGDYTSPTGAITNDVHVSYRNPLGANATIYSNPLWNVRNNRNSTDVDRITGSAEIGITPVNWLSITGRAGIDNFTDTRLERFAKLSATYSNGFLSKYWVIEKQFNTDVFARATKTFNSDFNGSVLVGVNYNNRRKELISDEITNLIVPNAPDILTNALNSNLTAYNYTSLMRTYAYYAQAELGAYDQLFLTLTGRSESASTFGSKTKSSFFFPSAALAWQFTKLASLNNSPFLSFGKLRLTWGQVGIQPQPYQNYTSFSSASYSDSYAGSLSSASSLYGGGYIRSTTAGNDYLRPEIKTEAEAGLDLRFLDNKINFSITGYSNTTKDVILSLSVPSETGYTVRNQNAAKLSNKGIEIEAGADVLRLGEFNWNLSVNFSLNRNKVLSLAGSEAQILSDSYQENASLIEGQPFGVFYSTDFVKGSDGKYTLDSNGFPQSGTTNEIIGNPNPKWRGGLGSTFSYKTFTLSVLFDRVSGNDFYNGTRGALYSFGTHADQGVAVAPAGGLKTISGTTIAEGTVFQGQIKDFGGGPVALEQTWYQGLGTAFNSASYKQFIEDGSVTRLREISLSYTLRSERFRKLTKLSSIDIGVTGRNLVLWTKYTGTDPEVNITGAGLTRGQDWFTNPNTKSLLFSLKINY
ncbi:MAG: SusC/RagA family TonB-linked outer membrane protein [Siphonobacter sp.]